MRMPAIRGWLQLQRSIKITAFLDSEFDQEQASINSLFTKTPPGTYGTTVEKYWAFRILIQVNIWATNFSKMSPIFYPRKGILAQCCFTWAAPTG